MARFFKKNKKRNHFSRIITYLLFFFLLISLLFLSRGIYRRFKFHKQLLLLEERIKIKEQENEELFNKIDKLQSDTIQEKTARLQLGMQKPGEQVLVIISPEELESQDGLKVKVMPNIQKWWKYFFK